MSILDLWWVCRVVDWLALVECGILHWYMLYGKFQLGCYLLMLLICMFLIPHRIINLFHSINHWCGGRAAPLHVPAIIFPVEMGSKINANMNFGLVDEKYRFIGPNSISCSIFQPLRTQTCSAIDFDISSLLNILGLKYPYGVKYRVELFPVWNVTFSSIKYNHCQENDKAR